MFPAAGSNSLMGNGHTTACNGGKWGKKLGFGEMGFVWCSEHVCQDRRTQSKKIIFTFVFAVFPS